MLDDWLILESDALSKFDDRKRFRAGPRAYATKVKQHTEDTLSQLAYCFVGKPVGPAFLDIIRSEFHLCGCYGAVVIPKNVLQGVNANKSKGIVGEVGDRYIIRGLIPSPDLRSQAVSMDYLGRNGQEEMVFTSPEDFPGLRLE